MVKGSVEQRIQTSIIKYIKSIGGLPIKQNQIGIYAQAGVPDIIACIKGRFVAIEVKRPGQKPMPIQEAFLASIAKKGGLAFWTDNLKKVKDIIKNEDLI